MKTTYLPSIFYFVLILATISMVESKPWFLSRGCNETTGVPNTGHGIYYNGGCKYWNDGSQSGYTFHVCSTNSYSTYVCPDTPYECKHQDCYNNFLLPSMNTCYGNLYYSCSINVPNFSPFGPSYATVSLYDYDNKNCKGEMNAVIATVINECQYADAYNPLNAQSFLVTCAKNGTVTVTTYDDWYCQKLKEVITHDANTCISNQRNVQPFVLTCHGY